MLYMTGANRFYNLQYYLNRKKNSKALLHAVGSPPPPKVLSPLPKFQVPFTRIFAAVFTQLSIALRISLYDIPIVLSLSRVGPERDRNGPPIEDGIIWKKIKPWRDRTLFILAFIL